MPGALVTGAGRGLGLEIARRLVGRGYEVAIADVDEAEANSAARQLGDRAWALPLDVTDSEAVRAAADQLVERCGSVDAWVNNAGILITGLAHEQPVDAYRRQLDVNYLGTVNGTLAAIDRMRPAGRGHIINVISLAGLAAATGLVGYSASKHAAIAFSLGTAADLRRAGLGGIRISCVCPDGVWTPMIADRLDDPNDALSFSGVMLMPEQVAEHVDRLLDKPKAGADHTPLAGALRSLLRSPSRPFPPGHPAPDARCAPAPAGVQEEGRVGQVASELPLRGPHDPGTRAGRFHTAREAMPLSGWVRYPAAWLRARTRPDSRASLARPRLDRLASPASPVRLVDPRARGRKVDRLVRAPGGAGDQPGGRRVLALIDPRAAGRGRSDERGPQVETGRGFPEGGRHPA